MAASITPHKPPPFIPEITHCKTIRDLKQFHAKLIKTGEIHDPLFSADLLRLSALSVRDLSYAKLVFKQMNQPNCFSYNTMFRALSESDDMNDPIEACNNKIAFQNLGFQNPTELVDMEEEDGRREAAIAKTPVLQPNFKPVGISQTQLTKFQELHRRRLQIKSKFKEKSKPKGNKKIQGKDLKPNDCAGADFATEGSSVAKSDGTKEPSLEDNTPLVFKKRKLHWGLDAKERWERKSNM